MKRYLAYAVVIKLLILLAVGAFAVRWYHSKMANAAEAFSVLDFSRADEGYGEVLERIGDGYLSKFLGRWTNAIKDNRNEIKYWQKNYESLAETVNDAELAKNGGLSRRTEFVGTNALYRLIEAEKDKEKVLKELSNIAERYKKIVDGDPGNFDAAYDYEYLTRTIENVSQRKRKLPLNQPGDQPGKQKSPSQPKPGEQEVHGTEGAPADMKGADKVKIFVPQGEDKSPGGKDAGKGAAQRKKG